MLIYSYRKLGQEEGHGGEVRNYTSYLTQLFLYDWSYVYVSLLLFFRKTIMK